MLKNICANEDHHVSLLAVGNIVFGTFGHWVEHLNQALGILLPASQIAVAVATVIYIVRKTHLLGKRRRARKPAKHHENPPPTP